MQSHVETAEILLEAGANPNGRDLFGFAPLMVVTGSAFHSKSVQLASLLIAAGADLSADLVGGATAIHFAARAGNAALIELLLNFDIPVDLPEAGGNTALYRAVEEQHESAVQLLLERSADPNATNESTWTCTLRGAQVGNYEVMKMLVQYVANVRVTCQPEGWSALHVACHGGHRRVVRLLVDKGWDVDARDANGRTPSQLAEQAGHAEVVEVLRRVGAATS
jgi:ankyrin repeat protein